MGQHRKWTHVSRLKGFYVEDHVQNEGCGKTCQKTGRPEVCLRQMRQKGEQRKIRM